MSGIGWIRYLRTSSFLMILLFYGITSPGWASIPSHERTGTIVPVSLGEVQVVEEPHSTILAVWHALVSMLFGEAIARSMDDTDHLMVLYLLENGHPGSKSRWRNRDTRSTYFVTLARAFNEAGELCLEYVLEASIRGQTHRSQGFVCREPDGRWCAANGVCN